MAKGPTKRTVIITLRQRNPDDPRALLQAIEDVFRPGKIEITVESPEGIEAAPSCPDEQLETAAREHAAEVLDAQDRRAREDPPEPVSADRSSSKARRVRAWLAAKVAAGWRFTVKVVLPVAKQVAEIAKDISEAAG